MLETIHKKGGKNDRAPWNEINYRILLKSNKEKRKLRRLIEKNNEKNEIIASQVHEDKVPTDLKL